MMGTMISLHPHDSIAGPGGDPFEPKPEPPHCIPFAGDIPHLPLQVMDLRLSVDHEQNVINAMTHFPRRGYTRMAQEESACVWLRSSAS
jgi:hypothetical protein